MESWSCATNAEDYGMVIIISQNKTWCIFYLCAYEHVCIYVSLHVSAHGGQKRTYGLPELELQIVVEPPDMDVRNQIGIFYKRSKGP